MTAPAAQWQLDRLSTSAREAAEIASLGAGLSLSSWLARLIGETCAAEGVAPPNEPPKILEFTREIRDRVPSTPARNAFATPTASPVSQSPSAPPSVPVIEPAPIAPQYAAPQQPAPQAAPQPVVFRPMPIPTPPAMPTPFANVVMPFTNARPQTPPPAAPAPAPNAAMPQPVPVAANALLPPQTAPQPLPQAATPAIPSGATMLPVAAIIAANLGTRRGEDIPEPLLADIATRGVRQPIVVRRAAANSEQYEIICGHRRWRAAQRVGLAQIPAVVVTQDDTTAILASLAENLQTGTLPVVDEAQAYLRLLTQCAVDASAVTAAIGRDRKHIVQTMRLLGLPPLVRHLIGSGVLSRDHAFLLLDAPNPEALADAILAEHLTVEAARQRLGAAAGGEAKP
jgi:ParB family transcriptional regulator, chromosome partitioning protein